MANTASRPFSSRNLRHVPASSLFVSEPPAHYFGNPPNDAGNPSWSNKNWLKSRFHFAFAEYRDAQRSQFGVLRVMNDDLVQPMRGFGEHPHGNMEICTYVVNGSLTHQDSMGTKESLPRGSIQFMTAGTGVRHQEHNLETSQPLRFIQMWIVPRVQGLKPRYGSLRGDGANADLRRGQWHHMVTDVENKIQKTSSSMIAVHQDVNLFAAEIGEDETATLALEFPLGPGRQAYALCVEGAGRVSVKGDEEKQTLPLVQHDAVQLLPSSTSGTTLVFDASASDTTATAAKKKAHWLIVEMAADRRAANEDL